MDTRQLAAFCAVVEKKSFSKAAERLGVTQPAVSLQIRALEKRLGTQLLDRSGRRVEPTEAGTRLYRNAQRLLAVEEQLLDELTGDAGLSGRLELGASTGPGGSVVPLVLCELQATHPDVSVALTVSATQRIVELVATRDVELGVTFISRSAIEAPLAARTLTEARVKGMEPAREIFLARASGRTLTRVAQAFIDLARERLA